MNEQTNTTTTEPTPVAPNAGHPDTTQVLTNALESLVTIGRTWAAHGLEIGKQALQTSARTLELTAKTLGEVASRMAKPEATTPPKEDSPN